MKYLWEKNEILLKYEYDKNEIKMKSYEISMKYDENSEEMCCD